MRYTIGLDLGQAQDYTAIVIVDAQYVHKSDLQPMDRYDNDDLLVKLVVKHVEKLPLGTRYTEVVKKLKMVMEQPVLYGETALVVDEGQVGKAVLDMMRERGLEPIGVTITSGQKENETDSGFNVPKRNLGFNLVSLFLTGRIKFAKGVKHKREIEEELKNFQIKTTPKGNQKMENSKDSIHDDLVMALALACWYALQDIPPNVSPRGKVTTEYDILDHGV